MRITQTLLSLLVLFGPVLCEDDYADNEEAAAADDDDNAVDEGRDNAREFRFCFLKKMTNLQNTFRKINF